MTTVAKNHNGRGRLGNESANQPLKIHPAKALPRQADIKEPSPTRYAKPKSNQNNGPIARKFHQYYG